MKTFNEHGDTIVEVLVVLAIVSFAIILSYSTANRSLADARQSEENSYATELAQSQVEQIRGMVDRSNPNNSSEGNPDDLSGLDSAEPSPYSAPFCMSGGSPILLSVAATRAPDPCLQSNGGTGAIYTLSDSLTQTSQSISEPGLPKTNNFGILVTWPDVLGQGTDTVTLVYRAYPVYNPS